MTEDSSTIDTINSNYVDLLSRDDRNISSIARIINRTLPKGTYKQYSVRGDSLRRGQLLPQLDAFSNFFELNFIAKDGEKKITYPYMTLPGSEGKRVLENLDDFYNRIDMDALSVKERYEAVAFIMICVGSAHAFADGSGRTAVGVADVLLRRHLQKKIDTETLKKGNKDLMKLLAIGTILMLPDEYNPNNAIDREQDLVQIPTTRTHNVDDVRLFTQEFADSIIKEIDSYDPRIDVREAARFDLVTDAIKPLADLLKNC